jgi:uncharacterized membrane protein YphA (DoxX/SURF4 family)
MIDRPAKSADGLVTLRRPASVVDRLASLGSYPAFGLTLRAALASPFLASGLFKLSDWNAGLAEFAALALWVPEITLVAVIATQICGSLLLLTQRWAWLGAGMLAVFTVVATIIAHPFWFLQGADFIRQLTTFLEHVAIVSGLGAAAILASAPSRSNRRL